jgi:hypothetical protein
VSSQRKIADEKILYSRKPGSRRAFVFLKRADIRRLSRTAMQFLRCTLMSETPAPQGLLEILDTKSSETRTA